MCLALVLSCEIPQSITVKGSPEYYLSLGSPFKEGESLVDYISPDKIREMMNDAASDAGDIGLRIYEYLGPNIEGVDPDVLAYLVHYPIVEMKLDLTEYVDLALQADEVRSTYDLPEELLTLSYPPEGLYIDGDGQIQSSDEDIIPLFSIPLEDLAKLVRNINGTEFGLVVNYQADFEEYLEVCVPAFGIGGFDAGGIKCYEQGIPDNGKLKFSEPAKLTIVPEDDLEDGELKIFVKLTGPCSGEITIELIFDWTSAEIDTSGNELSGTYVINHKLGEFLSEDVEYSNVLGYIYVNGIDGGSGVELSLDAGGMDLLVSGGTLTNRKWPAYNDPEYFGAGDTFIGEIPQHSLSLPLDLSPILNNGAGLTTELNYGIEIGTWTIYRDTIDTGEEITASLVILLPLEIRIKTVPADLFYRTDYVRLDLGDAFGSYDDDNDFFGRTGGDDMFKYLDEVTIVFKNLRTSLIDRDRLAVHVTNSDGNHIDLVDFGDTEPSLTIPNHIINPDPFIPFSPRFEILLLKDSARDYGTFRIMRQRSKEKAEFDFSLAVIARAEIEEKIDF